MEEDTLAACFVYGLRFRFPPGKPARLRCDSKREVLKQLACFVAEVPVPREWEFLSSSLKEWWKLEQRIKWLERREHDCVNGIALGPSRIHGIQERLDGMMWWYDERSLEHAAHLGKLAEVKQEKVNLIRHAAEEQRVAEHELEQMKEQLIILRDLRVEEQRKQVSWRMKISPAELDDLRERENVYAARKKIRV